MYTASVFLGRNAVVCREEYRAHRSPVRVCPAIPPYHSYRRYSTGNPEDQAGRKRLYTRLAALGIRAKVSRVTAHFSGDTFAGDMLARGASIFDVAKMLADTVDTIKVIDRFFEPIINRHGRSFGNVIHARYTSSKRAEIIEKTEKFSE